MKKTIDIRNYLGKTKYKKRIAAKRFRDEIERKSQINYNILAMIMILLLLSCIVVYSTSYQNSFVANFYSLLKDKNILDINSGLISYGATSIKRHIFIIILGLIAIYVILKIPKKYILKLSILFYCVCSLMVVLVPIIGKNVNGQTRWISILGFLIQPSDFYKVALILFLAVKLSIDDREIIKSKEFWIKIAIQILPFTILVSLSDLSTGIVLISIIFICAFVTVRKAQYMIASLIIGGCCGVGLLIATVGYRMRRIIGWLNLETSQEGYQTLQGLYAISSGGMFGKGIGNSMMKNSVPAASNDFVFTIICEEFGIIGGILLIVFFGLLISQIYKLSHRTENVFYYIILIGCIAHISSQIFINIGVTLNLIPNTGIGLPFLSSGGSSILSFLIESGIILKVSKLISVEELIKYKIKNRR